MNGPLAEAQLTTAKGTDKRFEPFREFLGRDIRPPQIEFRPLAVKRAVADQHQPQGAGFRSLHAVERLFEHRPVAGRVGILRFRPRADPHQLRAGLFGRVCPAVGPPGKVLRVFLVPRRAHDKDHRLPRLRILRRNHCGKEQKESQYGKKKIGHWDLVIGIF